jgi:pyridoxal phosphate enzyme (YggS family)
VSETLADRWNAVAEQVAQACRDSNRNPDEVTTIVVTKFHPPSLVRELHALGVRHVGENRHQDAAPKAQEVADLDLSWHFVGQLQSNKARAVAAYCDVIHSVDRESLVDALAKYEGSVEVFLEVNLTDVPGRGGVEPADLTKLAESTLAAGNLRLRGLMAVAPQDESPAEAFDRVLTYRDGLLTVAPEATELSLGMSGDFPEAIARGATHLRIGTAITGKRPQGT